MTMETIFLIVLAAFNVWTIYFYNKLILEVANDKEKEKKPPIDPMALVGKSLFKVSQLRKKEEPEHKQTESMSVSDNDVTFDDSPKSTARISDGKRIRDAALYTFVYHYTFAAKSKSLII